LPLPFRLIPLVEKPEKAGEPAVAFARLVRAQ